MPIGPIPTTVGNKEFGKYIVKPTTTLTRVVLFRKTTTVVVQNTDQNKFDISYKEQEVEGHGDVSKNRGRGPKYQSYKLEKAGRAVSR